MRPYFLVLAVVVALGGCGGDRMEAADVAGAAPDAAGAGAEAVVPV
ncbi:hypothetical protein MQC88_00770 [Luteimonas sp. 50]|uniref:Uncharacterized protein n=1 Tax=Cognatiluteimonas sedimenti TaxID=2927791 RepID=A0ABT0A0J6_9GAMM|nr:hypothetical protein [Lysobacter sedimenti]MCJ0824503.1 hypothetical protein [Lysobacter sedimenti]